MSLRVQTKSEISLGEPGKHLPDLQKVQPAPPKEAEQAPRKDRSQEEIREIDVKSAVESINGAIEHINRGLKFSVHEDTQRLMVKVVNVVTQEVIKELPPEEVLDTAARIREMIGLLIDERA